MPAKKHKLAANNNDLISVGTWKDVPHYAVIGRPTDFYLWYSAEPGIGRNTVWIQGNEAFELHGKLKQARMKGKEQFIELFLAEYNKRSKT